MEESEKVVKFRPTPLMLKVFEVAHTPGVKPTKSEWFRQAKGSLTNWAEWVKTPGFEEWWSAEHDKHMRGSFISTTLDAIGLAMTKKDYRYWEALKTQYSKLEKTVTVNNRITLSNLDELRKGKLPKMSTEELQQALETDIEPENGE